MVWRWALGSKWGVFRYPWVTAKLALIVSVMSVGGLVIGPAQDVMLAGTRNTSQQLIAAASYDVLALSLATGLSICKPGSTRASGHHQRCDGAAAIA